MTTIFIIILAVIIIRYAAKKATADPDEVEQGRESRAYHGLPHFNRFKTYYTDRSFRAYELYPKGVEYIDSLMKHIATRVPAGLFTTKSRTRDFTMVGGQHHGTEGWQLIFGKCKPEDNNQYDKNAVAVYNSVGKLMGYLSKEDAVRYRENFGAAQTWCYGFTYETKKGNVAAKLTCLGELFPSPKGQKTPALDIIRGGLVEYYGEMGYFKDHQYRNEEE